MRGFLWWLWGQCHPSCARCQPRIGTFPVASLCSAHRAETQRSLDEFRKTHPNERCTPTCGCVTLEELKARREPREMQLSDQAKAWLPEQWQQDAILQAWRTGKPVVGRRPE